MSPEFNELDNSRVLASTGKGGQEPQLQTDLVPWEMDLAQQILDICTESIYVKDRDGRFLKVTPAFLHHMGKSRSEDLRGKTDADIFSKEYALQAYRDEQHILATGEILEKEEKETWPDGRVSWVRTTKKPLRNGEGEIVGTFGILRNITERKLAEEALKTSEERFHLLFNHIDDSIFVYGLTAEGLQGDFVEVNDVACRRFGYSREELLKMSPRDLCAPDLRDSLADSLRTLETEEHHCWKGAQIAKDGQRIEVDAHSTRFKLDGRIMFLSAVRDVSERLEMEKAVALKECLLENLMSSTVDSIFSKIPNTVLFGSARVSPKPMGRKRSGKRIPTSTPKR